MKPVLVMLMLILQGQANAESTIECIPFLQQNALYFSSDTVTMGGVGFGAGIRFTHGKNLIAQTDASVLWANGNAVPTRCALGYQRYGQWSPAIFGTYSLLWGQRTEVLSKTGQRPDVPVWTIGLRLAPIRFHESRGSISALEFGWGIGPDSGKTYEITILSADFFW